MSDHGRTVFSVTTTAATVRRRAWTVGAVTLSLFCTFMAAGLAGTSGTPVWNVALGVVLNVAAAIALIWRHDKPWIVLAMAVVGPLFFATDATAALIALYAVGVFARGRTLAGAAVAVYLACAISLAYDAGRRRDYSALTIGVKHVEGTPRRRGRFPGGFPGSLRLSSSPSFWRSLNFAVRSPISWWPCSPAIRRPRSRSACTRTC